jgi:hypothetical protein
MTKPMRRIKCQVESLEDRQLPTVTLSLLDNGTTLNIRGDASPESLSIVQNDGNDQLIVSWRTISDVPMGILTPVSTFQSSSIKKVIVDLGGGDDVLSFQLDGNTMQWSKTINVDLGAGNDSAFFDFGGNLIVPFVTTYGLVVDGGADQPIDWPTPVPADLLANLVVNVKGGARDDTIDAVFGNVYKGLTYRVSGEAGHDLLSTSVAGTMMPSAVVLIDQDGGVGHDSERIDLGTRGIMNGARVTLNQRGGAGNDQLRVVADLPLYGTLSVNQFGGMGDDTIKTHALMDWQSTGRLVSRIYGEAGNDQMVVRVKRDPIPANVNLFAPLANMKIDVLAHGGTGKNTSWVTINVRTFMTQIKEKSWDMSQIDS